ncbi:uncharacterized protein LOC132273382 [Cornus florida]|uniref:uncharacterized protein LOC132273382 n=1 Tax=Cornus florida TaxID=4283 RepID=UPI00289CD570|nr:uncharacterized protein LOC132273382 [Cornus florida]
MAATRVGNMALLLVLFGVVLLGNNMAHGIVRPCPLICLGADYMTCTSSGAEKLSPSCNCCMAPKDCTLHFADGTSDYCGN